MLYDAIKCIVVQTATCCVVLAICAITLFLTIGEEAVIEFLTSTVFRMKGPWVWGFGFGLSMFIGRHGKSLGANLIALLEPSDELVEPIAILDRATSHRHAAIVSIPVFVLGIALTAVYRPPHSGVSYIMIFLGICTIYYVAGYLLYNFVNVTRAFHVLYQRIGVIHFRRVVSPLHVDAITGYLSITTLLGVIGIYAGFRGTVTAGFDFADPVWKSFLITPLAIFLPATLFYNWYPRNVLQQILCFRIFQLVNDLGRESTDQEKRSLLLDMSGAASSHSHLLPFLDLKSVPAYLVTIHFFITLAYTQDPAVKTFLDVILGRTSPLH